MNQSRRGHLNSRNSFRPIQATGGVISETTVAGVRYRLHSFLTAGIHSFEVLNPGSDGMIEYLVVGGGGGGGANRGGGGGAGALRSNWGGAPISLSSGFYTAVVGRGGKGSLSPWPGGSQNSSKPGQSGEDSSFLNILAAGGGLGGSHRCFDQIGLEGENGSAGGSGGGASINYLTNFTKGGSGSDVGGNAGGDSAGAIDRPRATGGGGGSRTTGQRISNAAGGGNGGLGEMIETGMKQTIFCGGGGGGSPADPNSSISPGMGEYGGGDGGNIYFDGRPGQENSGSGGGGGGIYASGGDGGSGIVIVRYKI